MRAIRTCALALMIFVVAPVHAAELFMSWSGHKDDGQRTIELSVGQIANVQIWLTLPESDTSSGVSFTNEVAAAISQEAITTTIPNWSTGGVNGSLDGFFQQAVIFAIFPLQESIEGPGEFLLGEQQLRLNSGAGGQEFEITIALIQTFFVANRTGADHTLVVTGNANQDLPGFVHLGVGSPGYTRAGGQVDERDPLIVRVVANGGGGDDGGAGDGGTGGGTDSDGDGTTDDMDDFPDDPDETTDTDTNGIGDNADLDDDGDGVEDPVDDFPQDPDETADTDGDGVGDNADPDATPIGDETGDGDNGSGDDGSDDAGSGASRGICGAGAAMIVPFNLLGLCWLQQRFRRR